MKSTQEHLPIEDIRESIVLLRSGGAALVLQTTAVNFDLLSEMEQVAIIQSYAQMLNSLSFPIQIVIRSKRLDITNYLRILDAATSNQKNPLLAGLMDKYRLFVQSLIKQNEVLDKHFFIIIPLSKLEFGIFTRKKEELFKKATIMLAPRKEQITRQLGRIGLKAVQLDTKTLSTLFYDIYNPPIEQIQTMAPEQTEVFKPVPMPPPPPQPKPPVTAPTPPVIPTNRPMSTPISSRPTKDHPFIVEELMDNL